MKEGYSITTYRYRLRCSHPEWLIKTQELYNRIEKFYYDLLLDHEEILEGNSQDAIRSLERLSLPGKEKRTPVCPLPWMDVPTYFRRAAANAGIAAVRSFLSRKEATEGNIGEAQELNSAVVFYSRMYRDFTSARITLKVWDGEDWQWMGCRLSGRAFPEDAQVLSPSVVCKDRFLMLHVPVKERVEDSSPVKARMQKGGNICGLQFTNGDAFAVGSVMDSDGREVAARFFKGGREYRHHCEKLLEKIGKSEDSLGTSPEGAVNRKYWMHLKHLSEHYAHQVSREIIRFCEETNVSLIVLPKYEEEYSRMVMKGAGNWGPLHLCTKIQNYLRYKAWQSGIIVLEIHAVGISTVCSRCGEPVVGEDPETKEYVCSRGHRGNTYLNMARNLAVKCRGQFETS